MKKIGQRLQQIIHNTPSYIVLISNCQISYQSKFSSLQMPSIETQTEQFLIFLEYEEKLTKLYQRIKTYQTEKQQCMAKLEFLQFKNKALEKSLFQYELKAREKQSSRNQSLMHDVMNLEQLLVKQRNQAKLYSTCGKGVPARLPNNSDSKILNRNKNDSPISVALGTIKQQPEIQNMPLNPHNKTTKLGSTSKKTNSFKRSENQQNHEKQKIEEMYRQLGRQEKNKKIMDLQIKRLRKMNDEYSAKCKRLEKLVEVKSELYGNLSAHLNLSINANEHSNYLDNSHSNGNGFGFFEEPDEESLFQ